MSKLVCLKCGEIYENNSTTKIQINERDNWGYCPKTSCCGKMIKLDENMIAPILLLNQYGIKTEYCCGGHVGEVVFDPYLVINCDKSKKLGRITRNFLLYKTAIENVIEDKTSNERQRYTNNMGWYIEEFVKPQYPEDCLDRFYTNKIIHPSKTNTSIITLRATPGIFTLSIFGLENICSIIIDNYKMGKKLITLSNSTFSYDAKQQKRDILSLYRKNIKRFEHLEMIANQEFKKLPLINQQMIINQLNSQFLSLISGLCEYINNNPIKDIPETYYYHDFELYKSELTIEDMERIKEETKNTN